jgi:hypothetical protein
MSSKAELGLLVLMFVWELVVLGLFVKGSNIRLFPWLGVLLWPLTPGFLIEILKS